MKFKSIIINSIVFLLLATIVPGVAVLTWVDAVLAAFLLGLFNIIIGIPLKILTLPFTLVTFGLFKFVVNGMVLWSVDALLGGVNLGSFGMVIFLAAIFSVVDTMFIKD